MSGPLNSFFLGGPLNSKARCTNPKPAECRLVWLFFDSGSGFEWGVSGLDSDSPWVGHWSVFILDRKLDLELMPVTWALTQTVFHAFNKCVYRLYAGMSQRPALANANAPRSSEKFCHPVGTVGNIKQCMVLFCSYLSIWILLYNLNKKNYRICEIL